jgi:cysteine sulfinate desulfinase/cysteine desulfurase-like protein
VALKVSDTKDLFEFLKSKGVYLKPIKDVMRISFIHETKIDDVELAAKLIREWLDNSSDAQA